MKRIILKGLRLAVALAVPFIIFAFSEKSRMTPSEGPEQDPEIIYGEYHECINIVECLEPYNQICIVLLPEVVIEGLVYKPVELHKPTGTVTNNYTGVTVEDFTSSSFTTCGGNTSSGYRITLTP